MTADGIRPIKQFLLACTLALLCQQQCAHGQQAGTTLVQGGEVPVATVSKSPVLLPLPAPAPVVPARVAPPISLPAPLPLPAPAPAPAQIPAPVPAPAAEPVPSPALAPAPEPVPPPTVVPGSARNPLASTGFIRASGTKFVDASCNEFNPVGWNSWRLIEAGLRTDTQANPGNPSVPSGQDFAPWLFAKGRSAGFNTMRFFALGDNNNDRFSANRLNYALQPQPGIYNETVFKEIDHIFDEASRNQIKIIVAPINNWDLIDGVPIYLQWCTGVVQPIASNETDYLSFYTDPECIRLYKAHISTLLNRVNTVNGRIYKEDPTIFAWDLINEPRCTGCQASVKAWIEMMASFFKSIDPNHMVTVGEEGFFGPNSPYDSANPQFSTGAVWPQQTGQDFVVDHSSPQIDFSTLHLWPDNWEEPSPSFASGWVTAHAAAALTLGKPLIVEEFGKAALPMAANVAAVRDPIFATVYAALREALAANGTLQGVLFWYWDARNEGDSARTTDNGITSTDSTWNVISSAAQATSQRPLTKVPGCVVGGPASGSSSALPAAGRRR